MARRGALRVPSPGERVHRPRPRAWSRQTRGGASAGSRAEGVSRWTDLRARAARGGRGSRSGSSSAWIVQRRRPAWRSVRRTRGASAGKYPPRPPSEFPVTDPGRLVRQSTRSAGHRRRRLTSSPDRRGADLRRRAGPARLPSACVGQPGLARAAAPWRRRRRARRWRRPQRRATEQLQQARALQLLPHLLPRRRQGTAAPRLSRALVRVLAEQRDRGAVK